MGVLTMNENDKMYVKATADNAEQNSEYYTEISDSLVTSYSSDLDKLMERMRTDCVDNEPTDSVLEAYILELSNLLYFVGRNLESVGIKEDLTKLAAKEVYNNSYLGHMDAGAGKKPTVAELTALSENDAKYQTVINSIYSHVYRQIKYKVDAAYEMLSSLRKIVSKRMQELQLSMARQTGGIVTGKEEF